MRDSSPVVENFPTNRRPDGQQQPTIPTALPTPSLTPTPPSRSNSGEDRQSGDNVRLNKGEQTVQGQSHPVSESNVRQRLQSLQGGGQTERYFADNINTPPSPISAPTTPVTASSASSTHGNTYSTNYSIARRIHVSAPIMPGPVKDHCYTKDISLVMDECIMGHGRDGVMRRTGNWHHRVGCMMCGGYGDEHGYTIEAGPISTGKHWLWLCSWCALRVCGDCRCRLREEEQILKQNQGYGESSAVFKIDLKELRSKILQGKGEKLCHEQLQRESAVKEEVRKAGADHTPEIRRESAFRGEVDPSKAASLPLAHSKVSLRESQTAAPIPPHQDVTVSKPPIANGAPRTNSLPTSREDSAESIATADSTLDAEVQPKRTDKMPNVALKAQDRKTEYPPRVSSRSPPVNATVELSLSPKEHTIASPAQKLPRKETKPQVPNTIHGRSATDAFSPILQASPSDSSKTITVGAISTFTPPPRSDSLSPKPLEVATLSESAIPAESIPALLAIYRPTSPRTPVATVKSPLPSIASLAPLSKPALNASSSKVPLVPAKSLSPPPPQPTALLVPHNSDMLKRGPVAPNVHNAYASMEKFVLPPLSFESELANEIDSIFNTPKYATPKPQATHVELGQAAQAKKVVEVQKGKKWYKGLFGGRK